MPPSRRTATAASAPGKAPAFTIHHPVPVGERFLKVLVYGDVGVGKTTFAASALDVPSMRDVLYIDAEAGDMSLTGLDTLDVIRIKTYAQLARIFEFLRVQLYDIGRGELDAALERQKHFMPEDMKDRDRLRHFRTVVIDSLSEVQKYLMYQLLDINLGKDALDELPQAAAQRDWLNQIDMIRMLVRYFRDLDMHFIIVCAEEVNDKTGKLEPRLPGKLAGEVPGFMDVLGYLRKAKLKTTEVGDKAFSRRLYLAAGYPQWKSKHRFRNLPDLEFLEDPTLQALLDLDRKDATANATRQPTAATNNRNATTRQGRTGQAGTARQGLKAQRRDRA